MFQFIRCPKCSKKIKAILKENRWVKWIEIICDDEECDYRENIENLDLIQPSSPFFKAIYGDDPIALEKRKQRERERINNNLKDEREIGLKTKVKEGILKPWEEKDIIKYTREHKLE